MNSYNVLAWLNFFVADVRDGLGPYLGVFLKGHGFLEGQIGFIGTITSLSTLILGIPFGILVDKTHYKRTLITFCILMIMFSTLANYFYPTFIFTLLAQFSISLCAVFLAPAFAALTLGIVGQKAYAQQTSRNEAYKHAGTAFSAALSFVCALYFGIASIFAITTFMGIFSLLCLIFLRNAFINHEVARGAEVSLEKPKNPLNESKLEETLMQPQKTFKFKQNSNEQKASFKLFKAIFDKQLLVLSVVLFCFHLSNAAMLPLLSQRAHTLGVDSSGAYAAATIIIAQGTMIFVALFCGKFLDISQTQNAYKQNNILNSFNTLIIYIKTRVSKTQIILILMGISLFELLIRGLIAAYFENISGMIIVQILDGVGAGITGVIVPILVAFILRGSGHINAGLAFVMTCGGVGGALSGSLGGFIAQYYGYFMAYMALALVAGIGLVIWCLFANIFKNNDKRIQEF
ncbi:MFS transporter [Campylobacter cuniculorum]|uniref:Major facilitator superfamily transporter n=2 Tax=Campylobacter cuniculorum TaxID=374106 RepID=A0A1W6BWM1_9BACT|nr:MFS transporter [Campylobacter cuniculorum]ARJ56447.1 major facilitator superfamily transporter [Campylobacter cuniculorum DSM 23162 = LMG 24588]QOR03932.1 MFS transporter [Campylobacter cuniculorum]